MQDSSDPAPTVETVDNLSPQKESPPPRGGGGKAKGELISIDNLGPEEPKKKLTSPRSIRAASAEGIDIADLLYKSIDDYKKLYTAEVAEIRFKLLENKR